MDIVIRLEWIILSSFIVINGKVCTFSENGNIPLVLNTWSFTSATEKAWEVLTEKNGTAIDSITEGCSVCEEEQCDGTVGYGGSPDEDGESTLDAMVFDGDTMNMGAVGGLRKIKHAIATARDILKHTDHSILVGSLATKFAKAMGFQEENLSTNASIDMWRTWKNNNCQPNFWTDVEPNPEKSCGPYKSTSSRVTLNTISNEIKKHFGKNHDTISMIAIDKTGSIVAGTSSNGAKYKIPGRIGDAPIPGAGAYADSSVGAGVATGDGDIMMRFLPSFLIVEMMRNGASPKFAATEAIRRIALYYPKYEGAVIAANKRGDFYAACHGIPDFPFSVITSATPYVRVLVTKCFKLHNGK